MKNQYRVVNSSKAIIAGEAALDDGEIVPYRRSVRIIEMVPVGAHDQSGTIKLVVAGGNLESSAEYVSDDLVDVTFERVKAPE